MTDYLTSLQPKTEAQKQALATANQYGSMVEQTRLLTSLQVASHPVSGPCGDPGVLDGRAVLRDRPLRHAQRAGSTALTFGALSIAFAIFLILELGLPYTGLFRVSPAALEQTIEYVDK